MLGQISKIIEGIIGYQDARKNQFLTKFFDKHIPNQYFVENDL